MVVFFNVFVQFSVAWIAQVPLCWRWHLGILAFRFAAFPASDLPEFGVFVGRQIKQQTAMAVLRTQRRVLLGERLHGAQTSGSTARNALEGLDFAQDVAGGTSFCGICVHCKCRGIRGSCHLTEKLCLDCNFYAIHWCVDHNSDMCEAWPRHRC